MIDEIRNDLEERYLDHPNRLDHVLGVASTAMELGERVGLSERKLLIASLLHDITKYFDEEEHKEMILSHFEEGESILKTYQPSLWHAFSAKVYAEEVYGIKDQDILEAIMHHTLGAPAMNPYAEILFLSDYIEPNRTYDSCIRVREIAKESIVKAIYQAMDDTITYHQAKGQDIPKIALEARDYYQMKQEELWKN